MIDLSVEFRRAPTATIFRSVDFMDKNAPAAADFSSRGPNAISPNILKVT